MKYELNLREFILPDMMSATFLKLQKRLIGIIYRIFRVIGIQLPPFASASGIIQNERGEILIVDLSYKKGWALPGGLLESNESFKEALSRETKEETNLEIEVDELIGLYHSNDDFPTVNALYRAQVISGKIQSSNEGKVRWVNPETAVKNIVYSDNRQGLSDYLELAASRRITS